MWEEYFRHANHPRCYLIRSTVRRTSKSCRWRIRRPKPGRVHRVYTHRPVPFRLLVRRSAMLHRHRGCLPRRSLPMRYDWSQCHSRRHGCGHNGWLGPNPDYLLPSYRDGHDSSLQNFANPVLLTAGQRVLLHWDYGT